MPKQILIPDDNGGSRVGDAVIMRKERLLPVRDV
jgi:hypothetical protein